MHLLFQVNMLPQECAVDDLRQPRGVTEDQPQFHGLVPAARIQAHLEEGS